MDARITIIIPCYNVEAYIDRCLKSIEGQTLGMDAFQIVLVDDGSTDSTMDRLIAWQTRYPFQIRIIYNSKNRRQGTCRNIGIKSAKCEFVAFVDADDWLEPDMYEKMLYVADAGVCDVVHCDWVKDHEYKLLQTQEEKQNGRPDRLILIDNPEDRGRMIASNLLGTYVVTKLYRRDFLLRHQIIFPENLIFEDIFWMGLLNCYASKIGIVEERLYHYYMNPESVSRVRNREQNRDIIKVNRLLWEEYQKRGMLKSAFANSLKYEMLCTYYLTTVKMIFLRYDEIPYDMFYEVQQDILEMIPDFVSNPYVSDYTKPFNILLLGLIDKSLSHEDIDSAANSMRILAKATQNTEMLR
ncbi:MAG: glycosyltransferase [Lachnospiraceae bacterium]|nr:glycosyltransferase [Lachnospiraceae bacterium]